jgi:eukaryotic-like serine/threonine-protein kinase
MQAQAPDGDGGKAVRWQRIKAIFNEAVELPKPLRAKYLDTVCHLDLELRQEVQNLLDKLEEGGESTEIFRGSASHSHTFQAGHLLSQRFQIVRFVGQGGMGEVYEAQDRELGGRVAIKTVRPELLQDPAFAGRFRREVSLARQVTHPNICRVFDVGTTQTERGDACAFFTMEFLEGETLSQYFRRSGKLSVEIALPLIRQMAAGLDALHQQGIVHRDFKPGNVMICPPAQSGASRVVINDFGLARAIEQEESGLQSITHSGQIFGTPDYMAPEQLMGQPASRASDIYALGLIVYEMVTGARPYAGSGKLVENAVNRVTQPPRSPRQVAPELPQSWEDVILACLAREPESRPGSARVVERMLAGEPLSTPFLEPLPAPPSPPPPAAATPVPVPFWKPGKGMAILFASFLALSAVLLRYTGWIGKENSGGVGQFSTAAASPSIALLPLHVLTDEPEMRVFAAGLMETITSRMSQYEASKPGMASESAALLVVPASEVRSQDAKTAGDAKRKFATAYAVEGSLQRSDDRLRLMLTLIDTRQMRQTETIVLEEPRGNSVKLQDAAVSRLANALNLTLQAKYARDSVSTASLAPGAYEYYLQARGYLQRSDQSQSVSSAETLLKRALQSDPKYALAHSALGETYLQQFEVSRDPAKMEQALESGKQGVDLSPSLPETNIAMGRIQLGVGRYEEAKTSFERAITLDGRNTEGYQGLANAYSKLKDFNKAEATYQKAISLRPGDWSSYKQFGLYYATRGEYAKAVDQFNKVIDLSPDNAQGYINLGGAYIRLNRLDDAERVLLKARSLDPRRPTALNNLGLIYLSRRQYSDAIAIYRNVTEINPRSYRSWGQMGTAYLRLGEEDKSKESFGKAISILESEILINEKDANMHSLLALYRALSKRKDYVEPLRRSLELAPGNPDMLAQAAETYVAAGDGKQAVSSLDAAFKKGYPRETARKSPALAPLLADAPPDKTNH